MMAGPGDNAAHECRFPCRRRWKTRIAERYAEVIARCREAGVTVHDDAGVAERIRRMLLVSDFAGEVLMRQPHLLGAHGLDWLRGGGDIDVRAAQLQLPDDEAGCMRALRAFRDAEAMRLVFRDANGLDDTGRHPERYQHAVRGAAAARAGMVRAQPRGALRRGPQCRGRRPSAWWCWDSASSAAAS